jgi:pectate lyase
MVETRTLFRSAPRTLGIAASAAGAVLLLASPLLAFEGFGATTAGGSGGAVVEVTSLADSGPGTLRAALKSNNVRIVFKVAGTIFLQSRLELRGRSYITVDGSTAPAPGITIYGNMFYIRRSHDIILTHLRVRNAVDNGILLWDGSYNVVIDHCSVTDSGDENIDITEDTHDVTVSWTLIGDTRRDSFLRHTKGMLVASFSQPPAMNVSIHHNLFVNLEQRNPQMSTAGLFDIRNNVIRNWGSYGIRIRQEAWGNIVNNVFETLLKPKQAVILGDDSGPVYISGNLGPGSVDVNLLSTADDPFAVAPVTTSPASAVKDLVLPSVGAWPRDAIDAALAAMN